LLEDLTGQIFGTINDHVATGAFGNVYRFEWRRPTGPVKVWPNPRAPSYADQPVDHDTTGCSKSL